MAVTQNVIPCYDVHDSHAVLAVTLRSIERGRADMMVRLPSRADHVGSLLRPLALKEVRAQHAAGTLSAEALRQVEDRSIREVIRMQEEVGLQAVTDGEYRRAFWHFDFLAGLDGVDLVEVDAGIQFSGGLQVRPVAPGGTEGPLGRGVSRH